MSSQKVYRPSKERADEKSWNADFLVGCTALRDAFKNRVPIPGMTPGQVKFHHTYYSSSWSHLYTVVLFTHISLAMGEQSDNSTVVNTARLLEVLCLCFYIFDLGLYWCFAHQTLGFRTATSRTWIYLTHVFVGISVAGLILSASNYPEAVVLRALRPLIAICRKAPLQRMAELLLASGPALLKMVVVMAVYMAYCMLLGFEMFGTALPDNFGTLPLALYNVFLCLIAGSYQTGVYSSAVSDPETAPYTPFFFLLMTIIGSLLLFKLLVGIATYSFQLASSQAVNNDKINRLEGIKLCYKRLVCTTAGHAFVPEEYKIKQSLLGPFVAAFHRHSPNLGAELVKAIAGASYEEDENGKATGEFTYDQFQQFVSLLEVGWEKDTVIKITPNRLKVQRFLRKSFAIPTLDVFEGETPKSENLDPSGIYFQHSKYHINLVEKKRQKDAAKKAAVAEEAKGAAKKNVFTHIPFFQAFMAVCVILSTVQVFLVAKRLNNGGDEEVWHTLLAWFVFVTFSVECGLKLYAEGPKEYWANNWHKLDVLCLLGNFADMFITSTPETQTIANCLLAVRSLRVLELLVLMPNFAIMVNTISLTLSSIAPFVFIYFAFIYTYAMIGFTFLQDSIVSTTENEDLMATKWFTTMQNVCNFDSYGRSMLCMFYVGLHGGWWRMLEAVEAAYPDNFEMGRFFFISCRMFTSFLLIPCFFGFVLQAYGTCAGIAAKAYAYEREVFRQLLKEDALLSSEVAATEEAQGQEETSKLIERRPSRIEAHVISSEISTKTSDLKTKYLDVMHANSLYLAAGHASSSKLMTMGYQSVVDKVEAQRKFEIEEKLADAKLLRAFLKDLLKQRQQQSLAVVDNA